MVEPVNNLEQEIQRNAQLVAHIQFMECLSARMYGRETQDNILTALLEGFSQSKNIRAGIVLCSPKPGYIHTFGTSELTRKIKKLEKMTGLSLKAYLISLERAKSYRMVIEKGDTLCVTTEDLIREMLPRPLAAMVCFIMGYRKTKEQTIITPIYKKGAVIGALAVTASQQPEYIIPSFINLSRHITIAIEGAEELCARRFAEYQAKEILEALSEPVGIFTMEGKVLQINRQFEKSMGVKREQVIGRMARDVGIISPEQAMFIEKTIVPRLLKEGRVQDIEMVVRKPDKSVSYVSMSWSMLFDNSNNPMAVINMAKNITRLKEAETQITDFSRKMLALREEEKRRIAADLHDEIGSFAVACKAQLALAEDEVGKGRIAPALQAIQQTRLGMDNAIAALKRIATDLRPPPLDITGLPEALRELFVLASKQHGLKIRFSLETETALISNELATAFYRVAQEALTNIIRHANASKVEVRLTIENNRMLLAIKDNGVGFTVTGTGAPVAQQGIGLLGMRERMEWFGGEFAVLSRPGKGTEVLAQAPLSGAKKT